MAWPAAGSGHVAWSGTVTVGGTGSVQRAAARLCALSCGNADGNAGGSGSSSARDTLMTTSRAQYFIRGILATKLVRSDPCSIVHLFDRKSHHIIYIVVSRRSDISATRPNRCLGYEARNVSL